jgi:L-serine dehydratase
VLFEAARRADQGHHGLQGQAGGGLIPVQTASRYARAVTISVLDMFTIGIGPSSSHTVGPMRAALRFVDALAAAGSLASTAGVRVELFGSLGHTGKGHGSDKAVLLGLMGEHPEEVDPDRVPALIEALDAAGELRLSGGRVVAFRQAEHIVFHRRQTLPKHPNGMRFSALDAEGAERFSRVYYSVGGGFVVEENQGDEVLAGPTFPVPHPFRSGAELLAICAAEGLSISTVMLRNEASRRSEPEVRDRLMRVWRAMEQCVQRGCEREGILPGGLKVKRRAATLFRRLKGNTGGGSDPLTILDWVNLYALAVNEENAAGGRVVTAPTNGAAGIIPAALHYYRRFVPGADDDGTIRFLLTAGAIGLLYKRNASISGAEVGCQGEVGVACSMAAGALAEVQGGTPEQVENAAEIAMEHNLGLTCDPIGGLVQVPCIERNAMGSVKALNAARIALQGDGKHKVSLDKVIATMRQTGADMKTKYKETARGGLAVNIVEC